MKSRTKRSRTKRSRTKRSGKERSGKKRSFGIPKIPGVSNYSNKTRAGVVAGSLALRKLYLDDPGYGNLQESLINGAVKKIRDDTAIKSFVKFAKNNGYTNITESSIRKLYK